MHQGSEDLHLKLIQGLLYLPQKKEMEASRIVIFWLFIVYDTSLKKLNVMASTNLRQAYRTPPVVLFPIRVGPLCPMLYLSVEHLSKIHDLLEIRPYNKFAGRFTKVCLPVDLFPLFSSARRRLIRSAGCGPGFRRCTPLGSLERPA